MVGSRWSCSALFDRVFWLGDFNYRLDAGGGPIRYPPLFIHHHHHSLTHERTTQSIPKSGTRLTVLPKSGMRGLNCPCLPVTTQQRGALRHAT